AAATSAAALSADFTLNSMLDWPDANQTSPTSTSETAMEFVPLTFSSDGPPAAPGFRDALQCPNWSAVTVAFSPRKLTLTLSPGAAQPHTCTGRSRCTTMWSA